MSTSQNPAVIERTLRTTSGDQIAQALSGTQSRTAGTSFVDDAAKLRAILSASTAARADMAPSPAMTKQG